MSYAGGLGGRTRMGTKVYLNVYDLSPANDYLYHVGFGLHHSGIEILGKEYTFAGGAGIFDHSPQEAPGAKHRERLELGIFEGTSSDVSSIINDLRTQFSPDSYNLITKNCNSFANAFSWALLRKVIPPHVNRLADLGNCCSCLLPKKLLENSPVNDSSSSSSGYQVYGGQGRLSSSGPGKSEMMRNSFSGSGNTLGGSSTGSHNTNNGGMGIRNILGKNNTISANKGSDDLTDRREKARKAALARLEKRSNTLNGQ
mmetsp:Transcript_19636/g.24769  ORF Transcript_19636/g.24769 Transcript_19636/m.24769 type:complete len:257 (-) Transcript_19636:60-830(-)|eukprot:CAMPEP_0203673060 /NCGR_PEP_ID=MMETSP0090-20130426/10779_1 /ASSEMBLY_ACC=CAM_ASM_001088 /TAXON_ID=426623 /ORGANISM="Chaetoceros affinis, Strain CCMP159" /LENGTH=256 /DNA_ID=CAMNT_0050538595 /DNA_START=55 /DNA_END=825 /DNA_ORIENTATION=-